MRLRLGKWDCSLFVSLPPQKRMGGAVSPAGEECSHCGAAFERAETADSAVLAGRIFRERTGG